MRQLQKMQHTHTHNGDIRRGRKKGTEKIFEEIMVEKFPNLLKNSNLQPVSSTNFD